jgi:beta-glucosidase
VVLNTAGLIDLSWADDPLLRQRIRALLYVWHGGADGAQAAASLLYGDVTPSGKLVGSIVASLDDHPASPCWGAEAQNLYQEDIYVGYRYFETFCPQRQFLSGLVSHTPLSPCIGAGGDLWRPDQGDRHRDQSRRPLCGQRSGANLPPGAAGRSANRPKRWWPLQNPPAATGESETLTLSIPLERFALDDSGATGHPHCYVMEPGLYRC